MVFRSHSHHQHTAGHCLSMLCAPSYGHWFTILDTEANLIISALAPGPCPSPQPPNVSLHPHLQPLQGSRWISTSGHAGQLQVLPCPYVPLIQAWPVNNRRSWGDWRAGTSQWAWEAHLFSLGPITCSQFPPMGEGDGSGDKGTCQGAQEPDFNSWNLRGRRRGLTPERCSPTSPLGMSMHAHAHTDTITTTTTTTTIIIK